jgi:hypothetical protein
MPCFVQLRSGVSGERVVGDIGWEPSFSPDQGFTSRNWCGFKSQQRVQIMRRPTTNLTYDDVYVRPQLALLAHNQGRFLGQKE